MLDYNVEYSISEAAEIIGYAPHVLRYYEKEFEIDIPRKDSNHRYYTYKEIELMQYIKSLKDKGFANKQIKMIINSPETILSQDDTNTGLVKSQAQVVKPDDMAILISEALEERFFEKLAQHISNHSDDTSKLIEDLKEEIVNLRNEINSQERDVLICENAKLKMKVKEKTYEIVRLKESLLRSQEKKGLFRKIFG
ncbi:MAG TPA: MerR family transcriptional regulator [Tissierellaceae bacterium]|nr:MerR family transcriptional regulator [Tissierellaceae bacterium]